MANKEVVVKKGYGLGTLVFIVFLTLKITEQIDWSWWWVTSPLWIPIALFLLIMGVVLIGTIVIAIILKIFN